MIKCFVSVIMVDPVVLERLFMIKIIYNIVFLKFSYTFKGTVPVVWIVFRAKIQAIVVRIILFKNDKNEANFTFLLLK